ncbi:TfoX/Sxy family protein [Propioniciclava coleopterorum]|uniref:TfoX/Sxy family protein n=1 Tax=Propioniciclava coleopterorum TaxID=2714937 RepID=A0A6G7Y305_9ACTN|nr:TfoX/Sxy family protein [Propioniciclava coleopterorum]QIK71264.1 TfoX/Sxy family protein [Propioniciclava coleopterorum]
MQAPDPAARGADAGAPPQPARAATTGVPAAQADLVFRLRGLLADEPTLRDVSMFGGRSFMVEGRMLVAAGRDGSLLVRVAGARHDELVARPGAAQAQMGAGRSMGPGWIRVEAQALEDDAALTSWLDLAREHHRRAAEG